MVDINNINPPEKVVTKEVFKPFHKICGAILEISDTMLKALLIPTAVAIIPKIAVNEPNSIILSIWNAHLKFLNEIKIKNKKEI